MISNKNWWCPDAISENGWIESTRIIMEKIQNINSKNKTVIFNAGKELTDIDKFSQYMDGYLLENFLGNKMETTFEDGLESAKDDFIIIYGVDTDDTGTKNLKRMRLGFTLSLLNNNTYFTYDIRPRDHGQAWWFSEYDIELGQPLGYYYKEDDIYYREFENAVVVSSPNKSATILFKNEHTDSTTKIKSKSFIIEKGDGKIFIK